MRKFLLCWAISLTVCEVAHGQTIGGVELRLGMKRADALAALRERYIVEGGETSVAYVVSDTPVVNGVKDTAYLGTVQFANRTLYSVTRVWTPTAESRNAETVYSALRTLDGSRDCRVSSNRGDSPGLGYDLITVKCGEHGVSVSLLRHDGTTRAEVSEAWSRVPAK